MAEKRNKALNNPLPPEYETPDWQANIQKALDANIKFNEAQGNDPFAFELPDYSIIFPFAQTTQASEQGLINAEIKECLIGEQAGETDISTTSSSQSDGKTPLPQASSKPQTMSKEKLQGLRYAPDKQDQR